MSRFEGKVITKKQSDALETMFDYMSSIRQAVIDEGEDVDLSDADILGEVEDVMIAFNLARKKVM